MRRGDGQLPVPSAGSLQAPGAGRLPAGEAAAAAAGCGADGGRDDRHSHERPDGARVGPQPAARGVQGPREGDGRDAGAREEVLCCRAGGSGPAGGGGAGAPERADRDPEGRAGAPAGVVRQPAREVAGGRHPRPRADGAAGVRPACRPQAHRRGAVRAHHRADGHDDPVAAACGGGGGARGRGAPRRRPQGQGERSNQRRAGGRAHTRCHWRRVWMDCRRHRHHHVV